MPPFPSFSGPKPTIRIPTFASPTSEHKSAAPQTREEAKSLRLRNDNSSWQSLNAFAAASGASSLSHLLAKRDPSTSTLPPVQPPAGPAAPRPAAQQEPSKAAALERRRSRASVAGGEEGQKPPPPAPGSRTASPARKKARRVSATQSASAPTSHAGKENAAAAPLSSSARDAPPPARRRHSAASRPASASNAASSARGSKRGRESPLPAPSLASLPLEDDVSHSTTADNAVPSAHDASPSSSRLDGGERTAASAQRARASVAHTSRPSLSGGTAAGPSSSRASVGARVATAEAATGAAVEMSAAAKPASAANKRASASTTTARNCSLAGRAGRASAAADAATREEDELAGPAHDFGVGDEAVEEDGGDASDANDDEAVALGATAVEAEKGRRKSSVPGKGAAEDRAAGAAVNGREATGTALDGVEVRVGAARKAGRRSVSTTKAVEPPKKKDKGKRRATAEEEVEEDAPPPAKKQGRVPAAAKNRAAEVQREDRAAASTSKRPRAPSPPIAGPSRLAHLPTLPPIASSSSAANSPPPPTTKRKKALRARRSDESERVQDGRERRVRVATARLRGNKGRLNVYDVVGGGSRKLLDRLREEVSDARTLKALKQYTASLQHSFMSRSSQLSTLQSAQSRVSTAKSRAKKLRLELLEVQRARGEVAVQMDKGEREWREQRREAETVTATYDFFTALQQASVAWR